MTDLILVGDRVLIKPQEDETQTPAGLYLPASVQEKERVQTGRVARVGPGYLLPGSESEDDEPWRRPRPPVRYLPLQAREGDFVFFLRKESIELEYRDEKYLIIPHHAILALLRDQPDELDLYGRSGE